MKDVCSSVTDGGVVKCEFHEITLLINILIL